MSPRSAADVRPDHHGRLDALDGLRTIAVFLVVFFHVSAPRMAAGFIGVDLFFVLSGYLITSGLIRELRGKGRIDLVRFWSRRIKRLMPAALLTIGTVLVVTIATAPRFQWRQIGADAWWSLLYVANWRFIGSASYFADDGVEKPLLHLWSLAVEEQFYLLWPLLLGLVAVAVGLLMRIRRLPDERRRNLVTAAALVVAALILTASVIALAALWRPDAPDRAYMGTDTKAFEPLLGALVACLVAFEPVRRLATRFATPIAVGGTALAAAAFAVSDGPAPIYFHGAALAFCVGGAGMIVGAAFDERGTWFSRMLAWGPVAYLGRISYGIYLWHWPYAVWLGAAHSFSWEKAALVVALTVATAAASYHVVEMPIRRGAVADWLGRWRTFVAAAAAMVLVAAGASLLGGTPLQPVVDELLPKPRTDPRVVMFVGDSVPQRSMPYLATAGKPLGLSVVNATAGGCTPLSVDVKISDDPATGVIACDKVSGIMADGLTQYAPGVVVWWSRYELADRLLPDPARPSGAPKIVLAAGTPEFWAAQQSRLEQQIDLLTRDGAVLVFVETDRPGVGMSSRCTPTDCHPFLRRLVEQDEIRQQWNSLVRTVVAGDPRTRVIRIDDVYCRDQAVPCDDVWNGATVRPDGTHFSAAGGELMAGPLMTRVQAANR